MWNRDKATKVCGLNADGDREVRKEESGAGLTKMTDYEKSIETYYVIS